MEASRGLDAEVAEQVMHLRVVARDWPCGYCPDGSGYEATHFLSTEQGVDDEMGSWFTDRGPVYLPERGIWPPRQASPDDEPYAWVEPVPFYSTSWSAAALVLDELAKTHHWRILSPFRPRDPYWFAGLTPHGCTGWNGWPDIEARGSTGPEAICKVALKAKRLDLHGLSAANEVYDPELGT